MNRVTLVTAIAACWALGVNATDFTDTAQVISATPIYDKITETRQDCSPEPVAAQPAPQERGVVAPILGGVAGAVLGRQVGQGSGRDVATAAGAVGGAVVGDRVANPGSDRSYTGSIVGGLAGAILGNQVGQGRGNAAATAAGAIAGAVIGDRVDNRQAPRPQQQAQRCRQIESTRDVIRGYQVTYRYNGRDATTTLPYNPGNTVRVGVGVVDAVAPPNAQAPVRQSPMVVGSERQIDPPPPPAPGATPGPVPGTPPGGLTYRY